MNLQTIKTNIQANAPQILLWGGTASIIAGGIGIIFTTKKQLKLNKEHKKHKNELDKRLEEADKRLKDALQKHSDKLISNNELEKCREDMSVEEDDVLIEHKRETIGYIVKTIMNIAIPAGLMAAGICMHHKSFQIISGRLAITAAALATTKSAFENYRKRVVEDQGKEKDEEYFYGVKKTKINVVDPETGKITGEEEINLLADADLSEWSDIYDETTCTEYDPNFDYNLAWIEQVEMTLNDKFNVTGIVSLNQAREALGMKPIYPNGQFIIWHKDKNDGINITKKVVFKETEDGHHKKIILIDFDCYGDIRSIYPELKKGA